MMSFPIFWFILVLTTTSGRVKKEILWTYGEEEVKFSH